ncbi:uncharacterized protein ARB_00903 [Trichophyton benhamiae CBS 112371]|uniref:DNA-directed RNA polymerase RBP11-like dimerisation domain-containing protein n=1 Tax=Arthroderma benhamiae (strain ATCC MYA-4681 / CBS 112371) TaxID=663331 RepID=D4AXI5_ARTBC|nr:uncharacterized protein ARB_00903 [Trichophyton benhamiae CBS 112371]EFE32013.1 hypothetical protein ARB_00903 [Trichophyton benhamiae CBS 112371]
MVDDEHSSPSSWDLVRRRLKSRLILVSDTDYSLVTNSYELPSNKALGVPSTAIFTFNKEDHTLGNLIRSRLLQNQHVLFSGYRIPHPLVHKVLLRVQTDGQITPKEAVLAACHDLVKDLGIFSREFTKEYELRKMVGAGTQQNDAPNGI